jgi:DNA-binding transcriptional LysR family regulator
VSGFDLTALSTFLAVMEAGGVSSAARRLGLARSVVSKRVAELEVALATPLFVRSSTGMVPTEAADSFYLEASRLLRELDDAANRVRPSGAGLTGRLRVAAPHSLTLGWLQGTFVAFAAAHPGLNLQVDLDDRVVDIINAGYDVALRVGQLADSSLIARQLGASQRLLCASPDYLERAGVPACIAELQQHAFIGYANAAMGQSLRFAAPNEGVAAGLRVLPRLVVNSGEMMREAALAGLGLVVLPHFLVTDCLRDGRLRPVLAEFPLAADGIHLVCPSGREQAPAVRALGEALSAALSPHPPWVL